VIIGLGLLGSDIKAESRPVHPVLPKKPVGTMFVARKLVMVVVVVIIPGT
jgi:hypothetical protein